jgi:DNA-binding LytR/AlgR family response regulator
MKGGEGLKISIEESEIYNEVEISIKCRKIDEKLEKLISSIRLYSSTISGKKEGKIYFLKPEDILYFDTVDEKGFIYTEDNVYETSLKLYEITERFADTNIIRINKSTVLNLMKIDHVSPIVNGRIEAVLQNGEKLIISRQYVPIFKNKIGD